MRPSTRVANEARSLLALRRAGFFERPSPVQTAATLRALRQYGPFGAASRIAAIKFADLPAISDERGEITFAELDDLTNRAANGLLAMGLGPGRRIGILCRNHRAPLIAAFGASRAGISAVWLNTAFSPRQAKEVAEREGVDLLIHDEEFADAAATMELTLGSLRCLDAEPGDRSFESLLAAADPTLPPRPERPGKIVLLTSGTTGTPKGAPRPEPRSLTIPGAILDRMPMRVREATVIGPPIYHGTGLVISLLSIALGSKLVLRRRFDAERFLDDLETHRATTACVVPVMLQRVLRLGPEEIGRRDLDRLRCVFCAGSQLPGDVATAAMDALGDVIYNLYGSTEVSVATLATPAELRDCPTTVGRPALGSRVEIRDDRGLPVAPGEVGRVFVGTVTPFEGYTGGGGKEVVDGLLSSGDVGHFDSLGRLHIDGRDDEMIVSGGENVFPREVEELLISHPALADAAALGVPDEEFGQRLRAFVVRAPGAEVSEEEVRQFVKENLAAYKVPREVVFVEELPRNPTGKVLKRELERVSREA